MIRKFVLFVINPINNNIRVNYFILTNINVREYYSSNNFQPLMRITHYYITLLNIHVPILLYLVIVYGHMHTFSTK